MSVRRFIVFLIGLCIIPIWLAACNNRRPISTSTSTMVKSSETPVVSPEPSSTPVPPTATPIPLAVIVNGEGISLAEFQAEVTRYQAATTITGTLLATDTNTTVMDELIDQTLLAQAAVKDGFSVDDTTLQSRISALADQIGGPQALTDWEAAHGYQGDEFTIALRRSIEGAWMRDEIITAVPEKAEEVHVLQILVPTSTEADQIYANLQSGEDFLKVATSYDPLTKGDLGWFPRGYLSDTKIEDAAFALQVGKYSPVIQTEVGYHILYLLERDPERTLQPQARRALQARALQDWLNTQRKQSQIQILVP